MPAKKKIEKTSIRKYAKRAGIPEHWLRQQDMDGPIGRSVVAFMAVRSAHMRGVEDARNDIKSRLGIK